MAPIVRIALIQLYPEPLEPELNYHKATTYLTAAAENRAQLAVLPEYHLTNWAPEDPRFREICTRWEDYLNRYRTLAKTLNLCIVPGTIVQTYQNEETGEEELHNIAYFIGNNGEILGRYQKKNIWHPERGHLTSSSHSPHVAFDTPIGRVGLLICWDLAFPEAFRELIASGAKTIIIPTLWTLDDCSPAGLKWNPKSEHLFIAATIVTRAFENTACIVFVNAGNPPPTSIYYKKEKRYGGWSQITMPFVGGCGGRTQTSREEGMSVVSTDMAVLEEAERNYKVRTDISSEDWHYTYRHQNFGQGEAEKEEVKEE